MERLKLTVYGGERDPGADALLDRGAETSVLLRGIMGFGKRHGLHTDRLLTLSEDLPLVAIAVDASERIEALAREARGGLVLLERVHGAVPAEAAKLTVYVPRGEHVAVCALLHRHGLAGATALLGVDGSLGSDRRRARLLSANRGVPTIVIAVGDVAPVTNALSELESAHVTLEGVRVCRRDGRALAAPHAGGEWGRLTVYTSEAVGVHLELVRRLWREGFRGATVVRGVWGYHGDHAPHGDRLLRLRRHVPVVTSVIDRPDRMPRALAVAAELTPERGLVTSEPVRVVFQPPGYPVATPFASA